jgi:hypothetical protein
MTERNRSRLRQFDNRENLLSLLTLAERVAAATRRSDAGTRHAATQVMHALAVELLIVAPMRISNLAGLMPARHLVRVRRGSQMATHIVIPGEQTKTGAPFEVELPSRTARLLELYRREYLPRLSAVPSPWLAMHLGAASPASD